MRVAVDAVVEHDGQILLIEYDDAQFGRHWGLPGGGVEPAESIYQALQREVLEETGAHVIIGRLLLVNEYDPALYGTIYSDNHELRLVFHCSLTAEQAWHAPTVPDPDQVGMRWIAVTELPHVRLFPNIGMRLESLLTGSAREDLFNTVL